MIVLLWIAVQLYLWTILEKMETPTLSKETIILVNLSGRGDKDLETVTKALTERGLL